MHVYFSTVFRYSPPDQGGEFIRLNWDTKIAEKRAPVLLDNFPLDDPNPRGNSRGGRGMVLMNEQIVATTYHTLKVFDRDLNPLRDISHPLMAGLHEIYPASEGHLWVTSTSIDAALLIDMQTGEVVRTFWPREMPAFQKRWGLEPLKIDKLADNRPLFLEERIMKHPSHIHFNAITLWRDQAYGLFNRFGAIVNLDTGEILIEEPTLRGCHNLIIQEDGLAFVNHTRGHRVHVYNLPQRKLIQVVNLLPFHPISLYTRFYDATTNIRRFLHKTHLFKSVDAMPFFVRGLDLVGDHLFIGISPTSILRVDWQRQELVDRYIYSDDVRKAVHGLKVLEN